MQLEIKNDKAHFKVVVEFRAGEKNIQSGVTKKLHQSG
jgi:hypothetical protein